MEYLFVCAIGPVQDFIFTARRSRDLWFGSWMLSELSKAAARALSDQYGASRLIFPAPATHNPGALAPNSDLSVANKVVAIVLNEPTIVGSLVEVAIKSRLRELGTDAFSHVRGDFNRALAERQLDDLVEYYWVGVTLDQGDAYARARRQADALLDARKATRNFDQFDGLSVPKSSLDGARESVIPEEAYPSRHDNDPQKTAKVRKLYQLYGARRGERLSGVDIVKRQGQRGSAIEPKFRSTSDIAARPFMAMVDRVNGPGKSKKLIEEIATILAEESIHADDQDGSLLYESRLCEWVADLARLDGLRKRLAEKLDQYAGHRRPDPYYALLMADGDNMGKVIDSIPTRDMHQQLSQTLSQFALEADRIVGDHEGVLVYAGGDDVLAYLPLHTALACARNLAERFVDCLKLFKTQDGVSPTLSIGLVVAHHLDPLSDALNLARQAEKAAKSLPLKDGLAITVSKRSGVDRTVVDNRTALHRRLQTMIELLRRGVISKGVAYELQELHRILNQAVPEVVGPEAMRIIKRKREAGGAKTVERETLDRFRFWIETERVPADELATELLVATAFADAADLAYGRPIQEKEVMTP